MTEGTFRYLDPGLIEELNGAAIQGRCEPAALLAGIDREFIASLGDGGSPSARQLCALHEMNRTRVLVSGEVPLEQWLSSAVALLGHLPESALFRKALEKVRQERAFSRAGGASRSRTKAHPRVRDIFVGRDSELGQMKDALIPIEGALREVAICMLQGMPGVGKSYLADRFALVHTESFPGGYVKLPLDADESRSMDELGSALAERLQMPWRGSETWEAMRGALRATKALLHIENADAEASGKAMVRLVEALEGCAVIVSGRRIGLGAASGWPRVTIAPLEEAMAVGLLMLEAGEDHDAEELRSLAQELGFLPLALHLAAGHLRDGVRAERFLRRLRDRRNLLGFGPREESDPVRHAGEGRNILRSTFTLSLDLLMKAFGDQGQARVASFATLGHAPPSGVGKSLGAAMTGISEDEFEDLLDCAVQHSLADRVARAERWEVAWSVHPLLAELLRERVAGDDGWMRRTTVWFSMRLPVLGPGREKEQGVRWAQIGREADALVSWLAQVPIDEALLLERSSYRYAWMNGPYPAWLAFFERLLAQAGDQEKRSEVLWAICRVAMHSGALDFGLTVAQEKVRLDRARGAEHQASRAMGQIAFFHEVRGNLDEALRIRREDELPTYERLGDVRTATITKGTIADILQAQGKLDEALVVRKEELLVYERLGDARQRALALCKTADILRAQGRYESALLMYREAQEVYERLGDAGLRAQAKGKIALVHQAYREWDEALRILTEDVLPVLVRLGDRRGVVIQRTASAVLYLERAGMGDRDRAVALLALALRDAEAMVIPEASGIREIQLRNRLT